MQDVPIGIKARVSFVVNLRGCQFSNTEKWMEEQAVNKTVQFAFALLERWLLKRRFGVLSVTAGEQGDELRLRKK